MKWFKHDTKRRASLKRIIMEFGIEGYGLYWLCIELIAGDIAIDNLTFELEDDAELIAHEFKMDTIKVEKIMHRCIELGLFDLSDSGRIRCLDLARHLDESISKNQHVKEIKSKIVQKLDKYENSGNLPEVVRRPSAQNRIDKNRIDKNIKSEKKDSFNDIDMSLTNDFFNLLVEKELYRRKKKPDLKIWASEVNKLNRIDGFDYNEIKNVYQWALSDDFWKTNILSTKKLRQKFDTLSLQMNQPKRMTQKEREQKERKEFIKKLCEVKQ